MLRCDRIVERDRFGCSEAFYFYRLIIQNKKALAKCKGRCFYVRKALLTQPLPRPVPLQRGPLPQVPPQPLRRPLSPLQLYLFFLERAL